MDVVASGAHDVTCPKASLCQGAGRAEGVGWSLGESSAHSPQEPWAVVRALSSRGPPRLAPLSRACFSSKQELASYWLIYAQLITQQRVGEYLLLPQLLYILKKISSLH